MRLILILSPPKFLFIINPLSRSPEHYSNRLARPGQDPCRRPTRRHPTANHRDDQVIHRQRDLPNPGSHSREHRPGNIRCSHAGQGGRSSGYFINHDGVTEEYAANSTNQVLSFILSFNLQSFTFCLTRDVSRCGY